jgi:hypothetical protein
MKINRTLCITSILFTLSFLPQARAEDSQVTRKTLAGLQGVRVLLENLQPNIQAYAQKAGITAAQLQQDIEGRLHAAGIGVIAGDDWLKTTGRPVMYVNVNTHETEKYTYAYDIKLELRQIVSLEVNPKIKTLADTWSINITGVANIGNLNVLRKDAIVLVDRFIQAYKSVNKSK